MRYRVAHRRSATRSALTQVLGAFMSLQIALAIALATGTTSAPDLCSGVPNTIEPDMRIHESDLGRAAAISAVKKLSAMIDHGETTGEFQFGFLNQVKIVQGHALLQQAKADRKEFGVASEQAGDSTKSLCTWLGKEGFWFD